jgi:hypothetical protein
MSLGGCSSGDGGGDNADFSIGGNVTGLGSGKRVVLRNNGADDLTVDADGAFSFATTLANGDGYSVTVKTQPATQTCTISNASGSVNGADVSNVAVTCATPALDAEAMPSAVRLTWNELADVTYNLYYATAPDCDIADHMSCPGGTLVENVTSPYVVGDLINGRNYWFQMESVPVHL